MADTGKKRVFYLSRKMFYNPSVAFWLGENYEVLSYHGENLEDLPDVLANPPQFRKIDALITCVPHDLLTNTYDRSLEILRLVRKQHPNLPVIAYTAAGSADIACFAAQKSIDAVVENKGTLWHSEDAKKIREVLDCFFRERRKDE